ncbi:MAG: PEP-CTERM sorting domain-containing protein [Phycisphaerales bacterium]
MKAEIVKLMLVPVLTFVVCMACNAAQAQGTANGPVTFHNVDPGPFVLIGNPNNPVPIDLDPVGPPWIKNISDPNGNIISGGNLNLNETIINVGTEPWYDWHEHILPDATGITPGVWTSVLMTINGNPVVLNATGLGTPNLTLNNFSQPVLPGDIMNIRKTINVFVSPVPLNMQIAEYPTPEPASSALLGLGSLAVLRRRKEAL